jgi:large subunit ribosomal protein L29
MTIIRLEEISGMSSEARTKKLSELRTELSRLRTIVSAGGAVDNPARIRELRKTIAQILTIENQQKQEPEKTEAKEAKKTPKTKEKKMK